MLVRKLSGDLAPLIRNMHSAMTVGAEREQVFTRVIPESLLDWMR
jgi:hypothetical protein